MAMVSDRCICLRRTEYSETSQIITLLAREHGMLRVIAKGAHRKTKAGASKFDGGVDLLDAGNAVFTLGHQKELEILTEWHLSEGHLELRRTLRGMHLGLYSAELVSMLIEEADPHPELFDRLEQSLLEYGTPRREEAFLTFELDLLKQTGYLPELSGCVECGGVIGSKDSCYFSPLRGGVICRSCEGATPDRIGLDVRLLRMVQGILALPRSNGTIQRLPRLTRHQTDPLNKLLAEHIEHTLGRRLKLPRYVLASQQSDMVV